jgi:hypothetical protein
MPQRARTVASHNRGPKVHALRAASVQHLRGMTSTVRAPNHRQDRQDRAASGYACGVSHVASIDVRQGSARRCCQLGDRGLPRLTPRPLCVSWLAPTELAHQVVVGEARRSPTAVLLPDQRSDLSGEAKPKRFRSPLCRPGFSQVAADREWGSKAVSRSNGWHMLSPDLSRGPRHRTARHHRGAARSGQRPACHPR